MPTSRTSAPSASSRISHIDRLSPARRAAAPRWWCRGAAAALLAGLGACAVAPPAESPPPGGAAGPTVGSDAATVIAEAPDNATASSGTAPAAPPAAADALLRPRARWVPVDWSALPGWQSDRSAALWPALRAGCARPEPGWAEVCARALAFSPPDDDFAREFLQRELQPYRVEAIDGQTQGLATGYFEPLLTASRRQAPGFGVALYEPPPDLARRQPFFTRQQVDTLPAAQAALRGLEIAWVSSPLDALLLQVQGSGRLHIAEPDGSVRLVRLAFAGHNDQPYRSVGRWLIEQGELRPDAANWPAIRDWGQRARPARLNAMLWSNPRLVFFREEPLPDESAGPRGAQGVALSAGRSVAVDPLAVPYGTPLWLDTTEPLNTTPLRRLVMAQDTGSAITGAVRVDYFWGWGDHAERQAGRMKQPLRLWALWPRQTGR